MRCLYILETIHSKEIVASCKRNEERLQDCWLDKIMLLASLDGQIRRSDHDHRHAEGPQIQIEQVVCFGKVLRKIAYTICLNRILWKAADEGAEAEQMAVMGFQGGMGYGTTLEKKIWVSGGTYHALFPQLIEQRSGLPSFYNNICEAGEPRDEEGDDDLARGPREYDRHLCSSRASLWRQR